MFFFELYGDFDADSTKLIGSFEHEQNTVIRVICR